ncbi:hypothetical protein GOP47_0014676 [Adiantum capillus-veneris]|uniref:Uncharacterized protein n=1 Tax=Adiantum capillus-veneris TaxID=13818 RepID=A0A9D4ULY1_ADICA|nr:hypothetical protein GOP47_0014676 [Adiantum capillus-veneris]
MIHARHCYKDFCVNCPALFAAAGELPAREQEEETPSCYDSPQPLLHSSARHGSAPLQIAKACFHPCKHSHFDCMSSRLILAQPAAPSHCSCDCVHRSDMMLDNIWFDEPHVHSRSYVHFAHKCTLPASTTQYYPNLQYLLEHRHNCQPAYPDVHSHACIVKQPLDAGHCLSGRMEQSLDVPASCIFGAMGQYGVPEATTSINVPARMDAYRALASPCPELWHDMTDVSTIQPQGGIVYASSLNVSHSHINQPLQHFCCSQASHTICSALLQPKCCQIAAHGGDAQERPCFTAPMGGDVLEHTYAPMGSALLNENAGGHLYTNFVGDASDHARKSMVSHNIITDTAQTQAVSRVPLDLAAHTRKLHSVWWGGAASSQTEDDKLAYKNGKEKHIDDDEFLALDAGYDRGVKPNNDGCFRKEAQKLHQNCWGDRLKNKRRKRYFCKQQSKNVSTWDGPSTSNVGPMSENLSNFKDNDGRRGHGNTASNQHDRWLQASELTQGTAREPLDLYKQTWEENVGLQNKEEYLTTTCTDPCVEYPKLCEGPASENHKKYDNSNMQCGWASPNARTNDGIQFPCIQPFANEQSRNYIGDWLQPAPNNNSKKNTQSAFVGLEAMSMQGEATVVMPSDNIPASCPPEGTNMREECSEKLLTVANRVMDFLSSSSDDRDLDDDYLYESDDAHYPGSGKPAEGSAKSRENQAYEFFMEIFGENEELQKRYKEEHGTGEFDCLVCSNIPNKPIKRYTGLVSVVMHAKKILNTKRRHDHRGFARAVCDFMGWDANGNSLVKNIGNILPRACLREPGDEKTFRDSEDELVGGTDLISSEVKNSDEDEDTIIQGSLEDNLMMVEENGGLFRPLENNVMMVDENGITHIAIKEDKTVPEEIGGKDSPSSEIKESENDDVMQVLFTVSEKTVMMVDEDGIIHHTTKEEKPIFGEIAEDPLVSDGEILGSKVNSCQNEDAIQEEFSPMEDTITILENSCITQRAIEEDTSVLEDNKGDKLVADGEKLSPKIYTYQDEHTIQKVVIPLDDTIMPGECCCSIKEDNAVQEDDMEDELDIYGKELSLKIVLCEDDDTIHELQDNTIQEEDITRREESHIVNDAYKEENCVAGQINEHKLVASEGELGSKNSICQEEDTIPIVIRCSRDITTPQLESHTIDSALKEGTTVFKDNAEIELVASGKIHIYTCQEEEAIISMLGGTFNGATEDHIMPQENVKHKHCTGGERLSLKTNTCQDANQVGTILNSTENDAAWDGARVCLQRKDFHDEPSSKQLRMQLEDTNVTGEEPTRNSCASMSNNSLVQAESSFHNHGFEAGQDAVKAFREQVLDKSFGLGRGKDFPSCEVLPGQS